VIQVSGIGRFKGKITIRIDSESAVATPYLTLGSSKSISLNRGETEFYKFSP